MAKTKSPTPKKPISDSDPVTRYAEGVLAGRIVAGPGVRAACERHLRDLKEAPARGFRFDLERAQDALDFFPKVLRLGGGEYEGRPFVLLGWQQFVIGSLAGWVHAVDGARRFRLAYVETAKGSGKSPLVGGLGLYGLVADGEPRAEIYAAATKKEQAQILFRDAVAAVKMSPQLSDELHLTGAPGSEWNIAYRRRGSFFRPIAADDNQSGPRVHMGLVDEIHEHKNANVVEMLRAGTKSRKQALIVLITNSGSDKNSVCWQYHHYALQVAEGRLEDDSFFSFVCNLDAGDDPFKSEDCWPKTNPSLIDGGLPGYRYLREQVTTAKGMPSREAVVRRLNFCEWTSAESPWLDYEIWNDCGREILPDELKGRRCVAGLDLASTTDLAALVLAFEPLERGKPWSLLPFFWTPEATAVERSERDHIPYTQWIREGWLQASPGRAISKLAILRQIVALDERYGIEAIAYDRWRMEDLQALANDEGITLPALRPFGQGFKDMSPAVEATENLFLNGELEHPNSPVLTYCAACVTLEADAAGNRKPSKLRSTGRIDGIVALVMALGTAAKSAEKAPSYQMFFV